MDGYSVSEAAAVLGVPIERVWELLARGILSGAPEGATGMRVFLQPRPAPPVASQPGPPPLSGPNGGEGSRELSPFRELLTEFRNLTERYGQALLALGESRGEVASLRSRVDLLEARMDLRLPGASPLPSSGRWGAEERDQDRIAARAAAPAPTAPPIGDAGFTLESGPEAEGPPEQEHRSSARGPRRATESFAEALARAEDPSLPDLPGGDDLAGALAHRASAEPAEASEPMMPRELAPAEDVPVADEPLPEPERASAIEPVVPEAVMPAPVMPEAGPQEVVPAAEPEPAAEPARPAWDADRYTADIEPTDWLEADASESEVNAASEMAADADAGVPPVEPTSPIAASPPADHALEQGLPGSDALGDALAALRGSTARPAPVTGPVPSSALRYRPVPSSSWPAGRAYRRLRRIFPN